MPIWGMDTTMIATLDKQINELMECKPLTETEVEALCKKVRLATPACAWQPPMPASAPRGPRRARC